jgi:hypothetical protein
MTTTTRQHVTDVFAVPVKSAELVRVDAPPATVEPPPARHLFTRVKPESELDDPVRSGLQALIDEHTHHLCVCSPNREEMLRTSAEMRAHPGYADYKARRDAAMGHRN